MPPTNPEHDVAEHVLPPGFMLDAVAVKTQRHWRALPPQAALTLQDYPYEAREPIEKSIRSIDSASDPRLCGHCARLR